MTYGPALPTSWSCTDDRGGRMGKIGILHGSGHGCPRGAGEEGGVGRVHRRDESMEHLLGTAMGEIWGGRCMLFQ